LEAERDGIMEQINAVDSKANQNRDQRTCEDLANFAENKDWLQQQISQEKAKHIELDAKTKELEKHLWNLIHTAGSTKSAQEAMDKLRRKQTSLEGRLVHALKTYNEALGKNMALRAEIDTLRMERGRFDLIYRKLDVTLTKMRTEINRLTQITTQAYDQREEAAQRIQALTEKAEKDNQQHNIEMKELVRLIDHDRKLKEFMKIKAAERQEDPQLTAWKAKRAVEAEEKRVEVEASIKRYEHAFERMLKLTNETSIDNIVGSYLRQEDRNFALFNYVSEINGQIEELVNENESLAKQITDYREWMTEAIGKKRAELGTLHEQNDVTNSVKEKVLAKLEKTKATLEEMAQMVEELAQGLACDRTQLTRRLAANPKVTIETLLDYLILIENRINEMLLVRQFLAQNDSDAPFISKAILIGGNLSAPGSSPPTIIPPNVHTDFEESTSG
uniref:Coiled-coil domain-containing protein 63 n=1 Tax=Schistocephalus solidus TaxID=70667 RepID=A0A183SHY9_SCHSO